jgi:hypothetical protein
MSRELDRCLESLAQPGPSRAEVDRSADRLLRQMEVAYERMPEPRVSTWVVEKRVNRLRWVAIAAVATVLAAAVMLFRVDDHISRVGNSNAFLALDDGSQVELAANSEYAVAHVSDGIELRLEKGSVIVTAAKQKGGHLYVRTPDCIVSVTGTVFAVRAEKIGSRVSVYEGEVRVKQGTASYTLGPGQQLATSPVLGVGGLEAEVRWSRNPQVLLSLLQTPAPRQTIAVVPGTESVEGIVTDRETGAPLAGVSVMIAAPRSPRALFDLKSGNDGRFKAEKVSPGTYVVITLHPGYWDVAGAEITIARGQAVQGVRLRMSRMAALSGRVTDQNGQGVRGLHVELRILSAGTLQATNSGAIGGVTNDRGEYEFTEVLAGKYYIKTTFPPTVSVYYPGTLNLDDATPLDVSPGAVLTGINLSLPSVKLYSIRFKVPKDSLQWFERRYGPWGPIEGLLRSSSSSQGKSVYATPLFEQPASTKLEPKGPPTYALRRVGKLVDTTDIRVLSAFLPITSIGSDEYVLKDVAPGKYHLRLLWNSEFARPLGNQPSGTPDPQTWATVVAEVEVIDRDVDLGKLASNPGHVSIPVRFTYADGVATEAAIVATSAQAPLGRSSLLNSQAPVLQLNTLDKGIYDLRFLLAAKDKYIALARYGTQDLLAGPLTIDGADHGALEIVIDGPGGIIEGVVRDGKGEPAANTPVFLVPPQYQRGNPYLFRDAKTDQDGRFRFVGIAPAEYRLFSWDTPVGASAAEPELFRDYETRSTSVTVRKGQTATANVVLIPVR